MTKFNEEKFIKKFAENFEKYYRDSRFPMVSISLTRIARQTCRDLRYAQWKNREPINITIKKWWDEQNPRGDDSWGKDGKNIFGRDCHLSSASGPAFVSIGTMHGVKSMDLVSFW